MSNKKTETKTIKEEVKSVKVVEEKTVSIPEKYEDEFATFLAAKQLEAEKVAAEAKDDDEYAVTLVYQHNINGKAFGPGRIKVKGSMLGFLMSRDQKSKDRELGNMFSKERVYKLATGAAPQLVKAVNPR